MTASIKAMTRDEISGLIAVMDSPQLTKLEIEVYVRFVLASTKLWAARLDGTLLAIWGLIPPTLLSDRAYLWFHSTDAAAEHEFIIVRRSQIEVREMLKEYPIITGHCLIDSPRSIRWLKWLGAKFGEPDRRGRAVPFEIHAQEPVCG